MEDFRVIRLAVFAGMKAEEAHRNAKRAYERDGYRRRTRRWAAPALAPKWIEDFSRSRGLFRLPPQPDGRRRPNGHAPPRVPTIQVRAGLRHEAADAGLAAL